MLESLVPGEQYSAADVAARVGVSRATAQRYLSALADDGAVDIQLRYGTTGRPEHRYGLPSPRAPDPALVLAGGLLRDEFDLDQHLGIQERSTWTRARVGRISPKTSPWARPASSHWLMSVRYSLDWTTSA